MKQIDGIIKGFGDIASDAEKSILAEWNMGEISSETSITDRFLESFQHKINESNSFGVRGIIVRAKTLSDRGKGSEEKKYGADFAILLDIDVKNFSLKKGFLCQAKLESKGIEIQDWQSPAIVNFKHMSVLDKLKEQAEKMLLVTPDSFVIIYGPKFFLIIPAISVNGLNNPDSVYGKRVDSFFKEFLMCFIGDRKISMNTEDWYKIKESTRNILEISIKNDESKGKDKPRFHPSDFSSTNQFSKKNLVVGISH